MLVVSPDAVLPLVNGSLRMEHREALKVRGLPVLVPSDTLNLGSLALQYVRLREDFEEAKVEGLTLQQLLAAEGAGRKGKGTPGKGP